MNFNSKSLEFLILTTVTNVVLSLTVYVTNVEGFGHFFRYMGKSEQDLNCWASETGSALAHQIYLAISPGNWVYSKKFRRIEK